MQQSLYDVKIEEANYIKAGIEYKIPGKILKQELYKEDGTDREDSLQYMYEKTVANEANLSDFEDFIFFVNQILLFGESRENVLWSESVQERLFSSFLNDASLEKQRKEHSLEAKYYDSVSRHKQEEIKAIVRVLKQIDVDNNEKKVSINKISLLSEIESLEGKQEQIGNNREICQKKIAALYKEASELSYNINNKEKEKTRLESKSKQEFWPGINPKYAVYKRQFVGNHVCPICNANLENKKIEDKSDECFFCHSKIVYDSSMTPLIESINNELAELTEKRKRIEKQIADYEIELSDYDSDFRSNKIDLFKKKNELRIWESKKEEKQNESSYLAMMNTDAGYKTPAIAKLLIDDGIKPLLPYKRPMTKDGFFKKYEYVYDEYYDCYICPNNKTLTYRTTNKDGYREYKSCGAACAECPYLSQCTESRDHVKTVTRHIWEPYMEICEDIRQMLGMKDLYAQRKETIERIFGTAKENHGFRYTQMYGKARMEMKVGLTFACMNLKKLAKIKEKRGLLKERKTLRNLILYKISFIKEKLLWDVNSRATLSTV